MATQTELISRERALELLGITKLREYQEKVLEEINIKRDTVVILPTGYGKSLCFQLAPFIFHEFITAIIVMPLIELMKQQCSKLVSLGFEAAHVNDANSAKKAVTKKSVTHIFISPECLTSHLKPLLIGMEDKTRFSLLFVDESHCIVKWGQSDKKTAAFRKAYNSIGSIRAVIPEATCVALTATATTEVVAKVKESLHMKSEALVRISPEKPNIRYSVIKVESPDPADCFQWLEDYLLSSEEIQRILIFAKHIKDIGSIYYFLATNNQDKVEQYHSKTPDSVKTDITRRFNNPASRLKVVISSSAFSMGIDLPELYTVIHYGMPANLDQYVQESGRVGRDGKPSHAIILYHSNSLRGKVSKECKDYIKSKTCRRQVLLTYFGEEQKHTIVQHSCCDICYRVCECGNCSNSKSFVERLYTGDTPASQSDFDIDENLSDCSE